MVRVVGVMALDYGAPLGGDAASYQVLATNLREAGAYSLSETAPYEPYVLRGPGFPAFFALTQALTGPGLVGLQLLQVLISLLTTTLLALSVGRWLPSTRRWVLFALALDPFEGAYCAAALTETLAAFGVAALLACLLFLRGNRRYLLAGLIMGVTALTRDVMLVLPAFVIAAVVLRGIRRPRRWRPTARVVGMLLLGFTLAIAPWTVRNAVQFGRFIPVARGGMGWNLWIGTWERNPGWLNGGVPNIPPEAFDTEEDRRYVASTMEAQQQDDQLTAALDDHNARMTEMAARRWREAPLRTLLLCIGRARFMWLGTRSELFHYRWSALSTPGTTEWRLLKSTQWGLNGLIVATGFLFLLWPWKRWRLRGARFWLAVPVVMTVLVFLPFHSTESRYSQPVLPVLVACGAALLSVAWSWAVARRRRGATAAEKARPLERD